MDITEDDMPYDFYDEFDEDMYVQEEEEPEEIIISSEMNFRHLKISITANSEVSELLPDEPLIKILNSLTEKEKQVLIYRFGLSDKRIRTLEETGRELNVTRERIRQIEVKALRKIKQKLSIWDKMKYELNDDETLGDFSGSTSFKHQGLEGIKVNDDGTVTGIYEYEGSTTLDKNIDDIIGNGEKNKHDSSYNAKANFWNKTIHGLNNSSYDEAIAREEMEKNPYANYYY